MRVHVIRTATGRNLTYAPFLSKAAALAFCAEYSVDLTTVSLKYV